MEKQLKPIDIVNDAIAKLCNIQTPIGLTTTVNAPIVQVIQELGALKELLKTQEVSENGFDGADSESGTISSETVHTDNSPK